MGEVTRRLAGILAADVVGYSRMMGADEAGTLAKLQALRREVIDPAIAAHRRPPGQGHRRRGARRIRQRGRGGALRDRCSEPDARSSRTNSMQLRIGINRRRRDRRAATTSTATA